MNMLRVALAVVLPAVQLALRMQVPSLARVMLEQPGILEAPAGMVGYGHPAGAEREGEGQGMSLI